VGKNVRKTKKERKEKLTNALRIDHLREMKRDPKMMRSYRWGTKEEKKAREWMAENDTDF